MSKLTDRMLGSIEVEAGRKDKLIFDDQTPGLGVRVTAAGAKVFVLQWTDPASKRKVREKLGVWGAITIDQARNAARSRMGDVAKGLNPRTERLRQKEEADRARQDNSLSLDGLVTEWARIHLVNRSAGYRHEAQRAIRYAFGGKLKRPAAGLTRADATKVLDNLVENGRSHMAAATRAYGRGAFAWAEKRGMVRSNPFQGLPVSVKLVSRDRVLTDMELADFWAATGTMRYPWGPFFRLAALTLQRRDEVVGIRWSEISEDLTTWNIAGSRMKNGKAHDVHLSQPARAILRAVPRIEGRDLIFSTTGAAPISGFSRAKTTLDAAMEDVQSDLGSTRANSSSTPWRLHDLRRTGVTMLARLGFDSIVVDKLLAHQPARLAGVASVYQRHGFHVERAQALEAWASHLVAATDASNVVSFHRLESKP